MVPTFMCINFVSEVTFFYIPALKVYLLELNLQAPYWGSHKFFCTSFCFRQEKDIEISYINITFLYFHLMQRGEAHLSSLCRILHFLKPYRFLHQMISERNLTNMSRDLFRTWSKSELWSFASCIAYTFPDI